ncbi:hypothetical protein CWS43_09720 [Rahnella sp. AA]|uniref:hypothetical protein n=1 Tax=Rahnella sp. AA TaxID=2057180 RepID=UPI000C32164F|nr:hypothetical protein [Rahnella sp. AA]PKE30949.1 hypothetical protein CWS43_09720 [Rahnella sp. AA]
MTISRQGLDDLEALVNEDLDKDCLEISISGHFAIDRVNDQRNNPAITLPELEDIFKKVQASHSKTIQGFPDGTAFVIKCKASKINIPCFIELTRKYNKPWARITLATIQRKDPFLTNDPHILEVN